MTLELISLNVLTIFFIEALGVVGMLANGFIIIINCFDWFRNKTLTSSDIILVALSLFRLLFLGMTLGVHCYYNIQIYNPKFVLVSIIFLVTFVNAAALWVATCLVVFYCLKIVNFAQPFLVKMKMKISRMVPQLLFGSMLLAFVNSLSLLLLEDCEHCCNETRLALSNSSGTCFLWKDRLQYSGLLYSAGTFPSLLSFFVSSVLLIHSLLQHSKKMRGNTDGFKDHMMDAHVKAVKTVISLLILYCATFAAEVSCWIFYSPWTNLLSLMMLVNFHTGHALIMIVVNPKLKQALNRAWWYAIGYFLRCVLSLSYPKTSEATDPS